MTAPTRHTGPVPTYNDVLAAADRLRGVVHRTPVLTSATLDDQVGAHVHLKLEAWQRVGAFKLRGAYNAIASLATEVRAAGVVAWSSGNHAQAVAHASRTLGIPAVIVMPTDAPPAKLAATRDYGAEVVLYDRYTEDREAIGRRLADERGMTIIPPFDHPDVVAGQATAVLELIEQAGPLDLVVVPIGGGGLTAGAALVAQHQTPPIQVVAVEPAPRRAARDALAAGQPVEVPVPRTILDGQQTPYVGAIPTAVMIAAGVRAVGVTDDEVAAAIRFLAARCKVVAEPSGASGVAALLAGRLVDAGIDVTGQRVGVVISGGNIDLPRLAGLLAEQEG